ncbi:MAG: hypothetical protein K2L61_00030, partial [Clostridia bacterium]|nr:hypothetical protein [Clostridia bacterium]
MKNMNFSGNENIDYSQSTKKTFGSRKLFLLIMAILAAVSDFALLVVFAISGHGGLAMPINLLILDGLFIAGVCLSNFRFKYSVVIWAVYLALSVFITAFLATLEIGATFMTDTAKTLNVFAHIALYVATVLACVYPLFKSNIKLKALMVTTVAIAVVLVGSFTVYFSAKGYFGQGFLGEYRVVGYTLDEESDTYIATDIKGGRSDKVMIPEEFNGKKVSGVNCSIFTNTSIKTVEIQSKEEISFVDNQHLHNINKDMRIGVDKKYIDTYRTEFLKPGYFPDDPSMRLLANCFYPVNLESDERYITFAYSEYPYKYFASTYAEDIIPTWIGKAGQEFKLDYSQKAEYIKHANAKNADDLVWCYDNNNAKILTGDMVELVGEKINSDKYRVAVDFTEVYRTEIAQDNDDIYEPSDSFKTTTLSSGAVYDYIYFTVDNAVDTLQNLSQSLIDDRDNGFDLSWRYSIKLKSSNSYDDTWYELWNLSEELRQLNKNYAGNAINLKLKPMWTMKDPTELKITLNKDNYIYGDDVIMTFSGKAPNDDCTLNLEWRHNGTSQNNTSNQHVINNALPQYGTFGVYVKVTSDKSSLWSEGYVVEIVQVNKRPLSFTWQEPSDMVYDDQAKVLQHFVGENELINGDVLDNCIAEFDVTNTNAGKYTASISLIGSIYDKYEIASGATYPYTIVPRPTQAQWTCEDFTYDGNWHNAQATAQDLYGNALSVTISSARINAGKHTATAMSNDSNYKLTNDSYVFEIKQKSITVDWSNSALTYSGVAQHPNVSSIYGLVGYDNINSQLIYSGYASNIDAGEGYTVKVELPASSNYKFDSEQSKTYNIGKRSLYVYAFAYNKVYDGKVNSFDISVSGLASVHTENSLGTPIFRGSGIDAVDVGTYSIEVSLPVNSVTKNYNISYGGPTEFSISKAQLVLSWTESVVKDGVVIPPRAYISDMIDTDGIVMGDY